MSLVFRLCRRSAGFLAVIPSVQKWPNLLHAIPTRGGLRPFSADSKGVPRPPVVSDGSCSRLLELAPSVCATRLVPFLQLVDLARPDRTGPQRFEFGQAALQLASHRGDRRRRHRINIVTEARRERVTKCDQAVTLTETNCNCQRRRSGERRFRVHGVLLQAFLWLLVLWITHRHRSGTDIAFESGRQRSLVGRGRYPGVSSRCATPVLGSGQRRRTGGDVVSDAGGAAGLTSDARRSRCGAGALARSFAAEWSARRRRCARFRCWVCPMWRGTSQITSVVVEVVPDTGAWHCRLPTRPNEWISGLGSLGLHRAGRRSAGVRPPKIPWSTETALP